MGHSGSGRRCEFLLREAWDPSGAKCPVHCGPGQLLVISLAQIGLCLRSLLGPALRFWGGERKLHLEMRALWGDLYTYLHILPCRPQGSQGYSRFPPVTQARHSQTGPKWGNPHINSSVCPAGSDSSRLDHRKSATCPLLPLRKVSLGSAD